MSLSQQASRMALASILTILAASALLPAPASRAMPGVAAGTIVVVAPSPVLM